MTLIRQNDSKYGMLNHMLTHMLLANAIDGASISGTAVAGQPGGVAAIAALIGFFYRLHFHVDGVSHLLPVRNPLRNNTLFFKSASSV
jgi:hypothetical protein